MTDFEGSPTAAVHDVDCTSDGKELCEKYEVQGYPTIKWGDLAAGLKDYDGGRSYEDLKKFADENLGPTCGPENMDLCSEANAKKIKDYLAMGEEKLAAKIEKAKKAVEEDVPVMKKVVGHKKAKGEL
eukprot:gnl/TRDRNA2_/TRDRNA2_131785_c0_seq3.p2 gnl/TRDRNA2_/TRDRNA2_131785_c0~~gnl/TRDRNA2_/TRDRNA2_131785_c0_seq3.p2  ORF type:complete len:128 (-),score=48.68 gnl/TRDRNA2_/TRDRNA2_131785_c0_seq3:44-427(-)